MNTIYMQAPDGRKFEIEVGSELHKRLLLEDWKPVVTEAEVDAETETETTTPATTETEPPATTETAKEGKAK